MAAVPDIWVDLPGMEGGPDRVSIAQLGLPLPPRGLPAAAWRAAALPALRAWFHALPANAWAGAVADRTDRSADATPEIVVHRSTLQDVLGMISPRQVEEGAAQALGLNRRGR